MEKTQWILPPYVFFPNQLEGGNAPDYKWKIQNQTIKGLFLFIKFKRLQKLLVGRHTESCIDWLSTLAVQEDPQGVTHFELHLKLLTHNFQRWAQEFVLFKAIFYLTAGNLTLVHGLAFKKGKSGLLTYYPWQVCIFVLLSQSKAYGYGG